MHALTFVLAALAAASAVAWGLKLAARPSATPVPVTPARAAVAADPAALARLLGSMPSALGTPAAPSLASRFQLVGVAARASHTGVALISVDGKPARPYRVGANIDEGLVLQSVEGRRALIGPPGKAPPVLTLELPPVRKG